MRSRIRYEVPAALLLLAGILIFALPALAAQTVTFSWTPPTQYEDGTPLPNDEIASYSLYCNGSLLTNFPNADGTNSYETSVGELPAGQYSCYATATATNGIESIPSNTVNIVIDNLGPFPPGNLTIIINVVQN